MKIRSSMICLLVILSTVVGCRSLSGYVSPQYDFMQCVEENNVQCAETAYNRWYTIPKPDTLHPLQIAAKKNLKKMASFLLSKGANPNAQSRQGITAVHVSAMYGHPEMLRFLIEKNGDPSMREKSGANAFDMVVSVIATLHRTPSEGLKLRATQAEGAPKVSEQSAKEIGADYLECFYLLARKNLPLSAETVAVVEKAKHAPDIKPNEYSPYFETIYDYLQGKALLKPAKSG